MTKFCKDCKYRKRSIIPSDGGFDLCVSPQIPTNPVTGKKFTAYASLERRYIMDCGEGAKYFEQKVTLWQRVKLMMIS